MANVAPIGASKNPVREQSPSATPSGDLYLTQEHLHIETEDGDSSRVVVLVEYSFKFHIQKGRAFVKAYAARRIKTTALLWLLSGAR